MIPKPFFLSAYACGQGKISESDIGRNPAVKLASRVIGVAPTCANNRALIYTALMSSVPDILFDVDPECLKLRKEKTTISVAQSMHFPYLQFVDQA